MTKVTKKPKKLRKVTQKKLLLSLTNTQKDYLKLLNGEEYGFSLTIKQISKKLNVGEPAVRKMRRKLIDLGIYSKGFQKVTQSRITHRPKFKGNSFYRLHREQFNIRIINASDLYYKIKKKGNKPIFDGNRITLHKKSINIYSKQDFKADDVDRLDYLSEEYWDRFFRFIQERLGILILKEGHHNIKKVYHHYSHVKDGVAEELRINDEKLRIYDIEDGKLRAITDFSHLEDEFETQHPDKAPEDMKRYHKQIKGRKKKNLKKQLLDWMDNDPLTNSDLSKIILQTIKVQQQSQEQIKLNSQTLTAVNKQLETLISLLLPNKPKKAEIKQEDIDPLELGIG